MTVRNATFEDMPLVARIMVTSFRAAFSEFVSRETMDACADPKNCRAMMQHAYSQGKMRFVLGEDRGFICWAEGETGAEIIAVHSLPESWGTGLGKAMMEAALAQIGPGPVYLWAFRDNKRARRFYEKHGFRWDGNERVSKFDGAVEVCYRRD
jgi:GNAT superfamily N-acetyltransferase